MSNRMVINFIVHRSTRLTRTNKNIAATEIPIMVMGESNSLLLNKALHKKSDTTCFSSVESQLRARWQLWSDG